MLEPQNIDIADNLVFGGVLNRYQQQSALVRDRSEPLNDRDESITVNEKSPAPPPRTPLEFYQRSIGASTHAVKRIAEENQVAHQSQFAALIG